MQDVQDFYSLTWQATPDLLGVLSASGLFEATNPAWMTTLGYSAEEVESQPFFDFVHNADQERTQSAFTEIQSGTPILAFENRYRHKDGSYRWLSWNCVPKAGLFYCSGRDITRSKTSEAALKTSEDEALLREQFIAILSHDLRNPMAAFRSGIELLERETLTETGRFVITESRKSIGRMMGLIEDLTDFARTRLGSGLSLDIRLDAHLDETIAACARELSSVHTEARIEQDIRFDAPVLCDTARISQMVSNLLANAITHGTRDMPIVICARGGGTNLQIAVTNGGAPIPDEVMPYLFEPFVRETAHSSQQGLGLGLFICAQIAAAHGGVLTVESGDGSTRFEFLMGKMQ